MAEKIVVALFPSRGIAEDARNRLRYGGVPEDALFLLTLRETTPLPAHMTPEVEALTLDPLVVGNVRETFAPYIHNGETAVFVNAASEADVDFAVLTLKQYFPLKIVALSAAGHPAADIVVDDDR